MYHQYPSLSVSPSSAPSVKTPRLGGAKSINDQSSAAKSRTSRRHSSTSSPKDCKNGPGIAPEIGISKLSAACSIRKFLSISDQFFKVKPQKNRNPQTASLKISRALHRGKDPESSVSSPAQWLQRLLTASDNGVYSVAMRCLFYLPLLPNSSNSWCSICSMLRSRKNLTSSGKRLSPIRPVRHGKASAMTRSHKSSEKCKPVPNLLQIVLRYVVGLQIRIFKNIRCQSPLRHVTKRQGISCCRAAAAATSA